MLTLREAREAKFLSQRELAEQAGVSRTAIANIELGQSRPYGRTARKIAEALGLEPAAIDWPKTIEPAAAQAD